MLGAIAAAMATPSRAHAGCDKAYTGEELIGDLQTLSMALRNLDEGTFLSAGKRLDAGIPCTGNPVPPPVFASAYRYLGAYAFLQGEHDRARRWFRTAMELDPTYQWDVQELEPENPMRQLFEEERDRAADPPEMLAGKVVNQPSGSSLTIDGRPFLSAGATVGRPHIIQQIATSDRSVRGTFVIDGNAIPPQFLREGVVVADGAATPDPGPGSDAAPPPPPKSKKAKAAAAAAAGDGPVKLERLRPPEKTPLLVLGVAGIAGAGAIYATSYLTRQEFEGATTSEELDRYQATTNALVIASGGVLLVGAGIGYWGIILDGGAGVGVHGEF
jgi:hypothetical protein